MPTITGNPSRDAQVSEAANATNYGANVTASISGDAQAAGARTRYHQAFDLAAMGLPAGAVIDAATVTMKNFGTTTIDFTIDAYERLADFDWTEGGATWDTKDGTNPWAGGATGGSVHGVGIGSTIRATVAYPANTAANTALSSALTTGVVQAASDAAGRTLHLTWTRTGTGAAPLTWNTANAAAANRPTLAITYHTTAATTTVSIVPTRDAWVDQANPTTNTGTSTLATVRGNTSATPSYLHLNWDIAAAVPAGATITAATLMLANANTNTTARTYSVLEGLAADDAWTETGVTYATRDGTTAWAGGANGGAVSGTDVAAVALGSGTYAANAPTGDMAIVASLTAATVQSYLANGRQLHLVIARVDANTGSSPSVRTRETTATAQAGATVVPVGTSLKPTLTLTYAAGGTAVAPGTLQAWASDCVVYAETPYTGDDEGNATFLYEWRAPAGSGAWTAADTYADRVARVAYMAHTPAGFSRAVEGLVNRPGGTQHEVRLTVTDANGVTGTAVQTATATTAARYTVATWPHDPTHYARLAWNSIPPSASLSDTTLADVARLDYVQMTRNDQAANATLRGIVPGKPIAQYVNTAEIQVSGPARNSLAWDQAGWDEVSAAPESWYLHSDAAQTQRAVQGTSWLLNPGAQPVREWWYRRHLLNDKQMSAQETAARRFNSARFLDNFSLRPRAANVEYPPAVDGTNPAFRAAIRGLGDLLMATGIICIGNLTDGSLSGATLAEQADSAQSVHGGMVESFWKYYSDTTEVYKSARLWKRDYDYALARMAEGRLVWGVNQIVDRAKADVPDQRALRFGDISSLMVIAGDPSLMGLYINRNADSYNGGYQRLRVSSVVDAALGLPLGAAYGETTGTAVNGDAAQWLVVRRDFQNGYARLNVDLAADGTGAVRGGLNPGEGEVVLAANNPIPSISGLTPASFGAGAPPSVVTIDGASFVSGATARINGATRASSFVSASRMTITPTSADLATAGSLSVTVVNPAPGGGASNAATLVVTAPAPAPTAISPTTVQEDTAGTITITGTGFSAGNVARLNGKDMPTTFVSATTLTFTYAALDVADPGLYTVEVA